MLVEIDAPDGATHADAGAPIPVLGDAAPPPRLDIADVRHRLASAPDAAPPPCPVLPEHTERAFRAVETLLDLHDLLLETERCVGDVYDLKTSKAAPCLRGTSQPEPRIFLRRRTDGHESAHFAAVLARRRPPLDAAFAAFVAALDVPSPAGRPTFNVIFQTPGHAPELNLFAVCPPGSVLTAPSGYRNQFHTPLLRPDVNHAHAVRRLANLLAVLQGGPSTRPPAPGDLLWSVRFQPVHSGHRRKPVEHLVSAPHAEAAAELSRARFLEERSLIGTPMDYLPDGVQLGAKPFTVARPWSPEEGQGAKV